ncbi:MAG: hypothetical protein CL920_19675 [Deltaproteobacteria bacterium]|nr:hypothetical protein [Deltaproteobacteria bacterium]
MNVSMKEIWERARVGKPTVLIGASPLLRAPSGRKVLRLNGAESWTTAGPIHKALEQLQTWLGTESKRTGAAQDGSLRYQLLGEMPTQIVEDAFLESCNRFALEAAGRAVLLFDDVDRADKQALEVIQDLLMDPSKLKLPWIIRFQEAPKGASLELLQALQETYDEDVFHDFTTDENDSPFQPFEWNTLPKQVLRVMRAAAVIGNSFEATLVAELLSMPLGQVLETLQEASDAGAPIGDLCHASFFIPPQSAEHLKDQMLPSLLAYWHEQLAHILGGVEDTQRAPATSSLDIDEDFIPTRAQEELPQEETNTTQPNTEDLYEANAEIELPQSDTDNSDTVEDETIPHVAPPSYTPHPKRSSAPSKEATSTKDQSRAAQHLHAAGQTQLAIERYLDAIKELVSIGDTKRGIQIGQEAMELLDELPSSRQKSILEARLLLEFARLKWHGVVFGNIAPLTEVIESLDAAKATLPANPPADLLGRIAALHAGVSYDIGDMKSLDTSLRELASVSRKLLEYNRPIASARLLNDQAALYIRLGDPHQATRLLYHSREIFQNLLERDPKDEVALLELAETEHLLARLPLHVTIRKGREADAYTISLQHTKVAAQIYNQLGRHRELARVWETMGRLEIGRGRAEESVQYIIKAMEVQRQLSDVMGLARSTAGLADVFIKQGDLLQAAQLLQESILLNLQKGTPLGLAFNRRSFEQLKTLTAQAPTEQHLQAMEALSDLMNRAESILGKISIGA